MAQYRILERCLYAHGGKVVTHKAGTDWVELDDDEAELLGDKIQRLDRPDAPSRSDSDKPKRQRKQKLEPEPKSEPEPVLELEATQPELTPDTQAGTAWRMEGGDDDAGEGEVQPQ